MFLLFCQYTVCIYSKFVYKIIIIDHVSFLIALIVLAVHYEGRLHIFTRNNPVQ